MKPKEPSAEELLLINPNEPCFCGSGTIFRFCCFRIADRIVSALSLAEAGKFKKALKQLDGVEAAQGSAELNGIRAQVLAFMGDGEGCMREIGLALEINPDYPRASFILGNMRLEKEDFEKALEYYDDAIAKYPPTCRLQISEVLAAKGFCLFNMKQFPEAIAAWRKGMETTPEDFIIPSLMARHIYNNPDVPEELSRKDDFYYKFVAPNIIDLDEEFGDEQPEAPSFEELDPQTRKQVSKLLDKAASNMEKGHNKKAIKQLEQALDIYPILPQAMVILYYLYSSEGEIGNAMDCLYELAEIAAEPEHVIFAVAHITIGELIPAILRIFPSSFRRTRDGGQPVFHTYTAGVSDPEKADALLESSGIFVDIVEGSGQTKYLHAHEDENEEEGAGFIARLIPGKNLVYLHSIFLANMEKYIGMLKEALGDTLVSAPEPVEPHMLFDSFVRGEYELKYDIDALDADYENFDDGDDDAREMLDDGLPPAVENGEQPGDGDDAGVVLITDFDFIPESECLEEIQKFVVEFFEKQWSGTPCPGLEGMSPAEALDDDAERYSPILAEVVNVLEQQLAQALELETPIYDFGRLRALLEITACEQ